MASPPCSPGCENGEDLGALQTERPTGCWQPEADFSRQGCHFSVPTERRTVPPRKPGICLHDRAGSQPRDFLRRPFQMRKARLLPSASFASGSASFSTRPSAGPCGVLTMAGVMRPWRCFREDASPCCPQDSDPQRHFFFLIGGSLLYNMVLVSAIHQHGSAICVTCPPSRTSLPSRLSQIPCVSSLSHRAHSPVVCFIRAGVRVSMLLSPFVPPSPSSLCPQVCSL